MFTLVGLFFLLVRMYGLLNLFVLMKLCCDGDSDWNQFSIVDLATASSCVLWTEEDVRIVCNNSQHWKDEFNLIQWTDACLLQLFLIHHSVQKLNTVWIVILHTLKCTLYLVLSVNVATTLCIIFYWKPLWNGNRIVMSFVYFKNFALLFFAEWEIYMTLPKKTQKKTFNCLIVFCLGSFEIIWDVAIWLNYFGFAVRMT